MRSRAAALLALAVAGLLAAAGLAALAPPRGAADPPAYERSVRARDALVDGCLARTRDQPRSWLAWESLANAYQARAWLGGGGGDLERAEAALARSFAEAPSGAGPFLARARLQCARHRWAEAAADLDRADDAAVVSYHDRAAIAALRAEAAHERGEHARAIASWRHAVDLHPAIAHLAALAHALEGAGDRAGADAAMARAAIAEPFAGNEARAWLRLQRSELALGRGDADAALRLAADAERSFAGWPRADEAMARALAACGDDAGAAARWRRAAQHGSPTAIAGLALALGRQGDPEAARWRSRSRAAHEALLAEDPVGGTGHALQHWLEVEPDGTRALALAEAHSARRPGGEGLILLARAQRLACADDDARASLTKAAAIGWHPPAWHALAAAIGGVDGPLASAP